jgi:two-component system phosphate regulon sensor histidine kinase PhoR
MLLRPLNVSLPRRITAYFLLFGLAAVLSLGLGAAYVAHSAYHARTEGTILRWLGRASSQIVLDYLRVGTDGFRKGVNEAQRQHGVAYCAIVSPEGVFVVHSRREEEGQRAPERSGGRDRWGEVVRLSLRTESGSNISEYQVPLVAGDQRLGELRLGITELSFWNLASMVGKFAPLIIIGPACCIAGGAVLLNRMVRPFAEIEQQLSSVATSPAIESVNFDEVPALGLAAMGWNQIVLQRLKQESSDELQSRLRESLHEKHENRLYTVLMGIPDGIATTDRQGRITFLNPAAAALLGTADLVGDPRKDKGAPEGPLMLTEIARYWQLPEDSPLHETSTTDRPIAIELTEPEESTGRVIRVACHPLSVGSAGQESHVWVIRDVTQQKLADKMRNQFVDTATHELRTPLANIKAYAETLALTEMIDVEQQKQFLNTINAEATRLARFVDDLLNVSSIEVGSLTLSKQMTDLGRMLNEVLAKVRAQMEDKKLTFETLFPEKFPEPALDKDKVAAVLVNLLGNAAKYTPEGGRVSFRVRPNGENLEISIEDTGVGISEQDLPRVFEKFFRSNDPRVQEQTGTGLGLSLAREVVRLHGGDITVESKLDKGSTFHVTLPLT